MIPENLEIWGIFTNDDKISSMISKDLYHFLKNDYKLKYKKLSISEIVTYKLQGIIKYEKDRD